MREYQSPTQLKSDPFAFGRPTKTKTMGPQSREEREAQILPRLFDYSEEHRWIAVAR